MKKAVIFLIGVLMIFGLFGCHKQNTEPVLPAEETIELQVTNQVLDADIWVIPDLPENRKTTMWGTTNFKTMKNGEARTAAAAYAQTEQYLIRVIDVDKMYYEANAVALKDGQAIVIREGDAAMSAFADVYSKDGKLIESYEMFMAKL